MMVICTGEAGLLADILVTVDNLAKSYGDLVAVDGISFRIKKGEVFGLLGPNGAGKTTTIKMLCTVLQPDSGGATVGGHSIVTQPENVRGVIGFCPQELALYEELSALDNVVFFGRMAGLDAEEAVRKAKECLSELGLSDRQRDRVFTFSGGMKRRVNLAISLVHDPDLLFLDEPTVGVDAQTRARIFETVGEMISGGMTVLYTTHYMEEAEALCDRIAIMDHGGILEIGTSKELKTLLTDEDSPTLEDVFLHLTGRTLKN